MCIHGVFIGVSDTHSAMIDDCKVTVSFHAIKSTGWNTIDVCQIGLHASLHVEMRRASIALMVLTCGRGWILKGGTYYHFGTCGWVLFWADLNFSAMWIKVTVKG